MEGYLITAAIIALIVTALVYNERHPGFWELERRRRSETRTKEIERTAGISAALIFAVLLGTASPASAQPDNGGYAAAERFCETGEPVSAQHPCPGSEEARRLLLAAARASGESEEAQWCKADPALVCPKHPTVTLTLAQLEYAIETAGEFLSDDYPELFGGRGGGIYGEP